MFAWTSWNDHFELHDPVGPCPALSGPVGSVPSVPLGLPCEGHWPSWTSVDPTWVVPGAIRPRPLARPAKELAQRRHQADQGDRWEDRWETHGRPMESLWNTFPLQKWSGSLRSTTRSKWQDPQYVQRLGGNKKRIKIIHMISYAFICHMPIVPSVDVFPHLHTFVGICRSENREPRNAAEGTSGPEPGEAKVSPEEPPLRFCWGPGWAWYVAVPLDQKVLCSQAGLSHLVFFFWEVLPLVLQCWTSAFQQLSTTKPQHKRCRTNHVKRITLLTGQEAVILPPRPAAFWKPHVWLKRNHSLGFSQQRVPTLLMIYVPANPQSRLWLQTVLTQNCQPDLVLPCHFVGFNSHSIPP